MKDIDRVHDILVKRIKLYESLMSEYHVDCTREIEALKKVLVEIELEFSI